MARKTARSAAIEESFSTGENTPAETTSDDASMDEDDRPETSPYLEPAFTFNIGLNRNSYIVPQLYARQSPAFEPYNMWGPPTIELPEVDEDIGHTLVHYLYTGTYQTLKPHGASGPPNSAMEYRRGILVYCTARLYQLDSLVEHAIRNMGLFDKQLPIFDILDIITDIYPKLRADEIWLLDYLKAKIEAAYEADETMFAQDQFLNYIGEGTAFNKALVKIMVGIYTDKITSMAKEKVSVAEEYPPEEPQQTAPDQPEEPISEEPEIVPDEHEPPENPVPYEPEEPTSYQSQECFAKEAAPLVEEIANISGVDDDWGSFSSVKKKSKKKKKGKKVTYDEDALPVENDIPLVEVYAPAMEEDASPIGKDTSPIEEVANSSGIEDGWGGFSSLKKKSKKGKKGKKVTYEEDALPVEENVLTVEVDAPPMEEDAPLPEPIPADDPPHPSEKEEDWPSSKKKKKGKKGKNITFAVSDERAPIDVEPPSELRAAPADEPELDTWFSDPAKVKESKKGKQSRMYEESLCGEPPCGEPPHEELACEELGLEDALELPSIEPSFERSDACPFQARHIFDGDSWKTCNTCRAVVLQLSIGLAHEGNLRWQESGET